MHRIDVIKPR